MGKSKDLATGAAYQDQTESDTRYVNATGGDSMINDGEVLKLSRTSGQSENLILSTQAAAGISGTTYVGQVESAGNNALEVFTTGALPVHIGTNNAVRMTVDGSGRVTTPYNPYFWVQAATSGAANYSGGGVLFTGGLVNSSSISDIGGHFDTSTGRFTAPVSGVYHFSAVVRVDSFGGSYSYLTLWDSGSVAFCRDLSEITGNYKTHTVAASRYLSANDYVYSHIATAGDTSTTISSDSYFSGHLVG